MSLQKSALFRLIFVANIPSFASPLFPFHHLLLKGKFFQSAFFIGPRCPWGPIYGSGCHFLREVFGNLTDVTLADGHTKPILTDNANRAIQGNVAMYVTQLGETNANAAM